MAMVMAMAMTICGVVAVLFGAVMVGGVTKAEFEEHIQAERSYLEAVVLVCEQQRQKSWIIVEYKQRKLRSGG